MIINQALYLFIYLFNIGFGKALLFAEGDDFDASQVEQKESFEFFSKSENHVALRVEEIPLALK